MPKIQVDINFGSKKLEELINELVQDKIKHVTHKLRNGEADSYNKNESYILSNSEDKADKIK